MCRITKMTRTPEGFLTARITPEGGRTIEVHNEHGSWVGTVDGRTNHVLPKYAARLQENARAYMRREQRQEVPA